MIALIDTIAIWFPGALALLALICASGFFSGSETAIFYLSRAELRQFSKGKSSEQIVAALAADADRLLTAVLFWNLLINLSYFAVSGVIAKELADEGQPAAADFSRWAACWRSFCLEKCFPKVSRLFSARKLRSWSAGRWHFRYACWIR